MSQWCKKTCTSSFRICRAYRSLSWLKIPVQCALNYAFDASRLLGLGFKSVSYCSLLTFVENHVSWRWWSTWRLAPDAEQLNINLVIPANDTRKTRHVYCRVSSLFNRPFYSCVLSYLAMNASEAGVELALIQTSLLFSCKCQLVSIRTTWFAQ